MSTAHHCLANTFVYAENQVGMPRYLDAGMEAGKDLACWKMAG